MTAKTADRPSIRRIAISTGGGDAPGLNAVIRAAVLAGLRRGWEIVGIRDGYDGLLEPARYAGEGGGVVVLDAESVRGITHVGGTLLGTTNKGSPLQWGPDERDRTGDVADAARRAGIDGLIAIGGDGSMAIAAALAKQGMRVVGVPKTIDNDLDGTVVTFGFETAVSFATECIDRLHTTAASHKRVLVVEVMGRYAGWIALYAGIAGTADVILMPEIPYELDKVVAKIEERDRAGRMFSIVVVAEGAHPRGGDRVLTAAKGAGHVERLGGIGERLAKELGAHVKHEVRAVVLGHLLRGGSPVAFDRLIALRFGAAAVRALEAGEHGVMVALDPPDVRYVSLEEATRRMKTVPLECDAVLTARELGTCLGD